MTDAAVPVIRLTTSRSAYRRAGVVVGGSVSPTVLSIADWFALGMDRQALILGDPNIEIATSYDGVTFKRLSVGGRAEALEAYSKFMTGQAEGADTVAPTPQTDASTAPGAAVAAGDDSAQAGTAGEFQTPAEATQPVADPVPAPVAASTPTPSGRAPKAAKPKASEARVAS